MNPVEQAIKEKRVDKSVKLLENKKSKVTDKVTSELGKLESFGINNTTAQYLKEKVREDNHEIENIVKHNRKADAIYNVAKLFFPYAVISYKDMNDLAQRYGFVISDLSYYLAPIPEENVEELHSFKDHFTKIANKEVYKESDVWKNSPSLEMDRLIKFNRPMLHCFSDLYLDTVQQLDFTNSLKILAPMGSFKFPKQARRIGNEIALLDKKRVGFKFGGIRFNPPKFTDPVIFLPYMFADQIYCIVITAWDKIADDSRIRNLI